MCFIYIYLLIVLACHDYESSEYCSDYSDYFADNFEILELIGHGCFSVVYKVRSKKDNQIFALKKTKSSFKGNSDRYHVYFVFLFSFLLEILV